MHRWGDKDFTDEMFNDVENAAREIGEFCRKWGRINVRQTKEKYGTARVYCSFGWTQLFSITHPGYVYSRYPQWLWSLDVFYISRIITRLNWVVVPLHTRLYRYAYKRTIKRYPHIRSEILWAADYPECLKNL